MTRRVRSRGTARSRDPVTLFEAMRFSVAVGAAAVAFAALGAPVSAALSGSAAHSSNTLRGGITDRHASVSFGAFRIIVPDSWHWRFLPGLTGKAIQVSNASLRVPVGADPIKEMTAGTFVLTLLPLGAHGSVTTPVVARRQFLARSDPARPRGHALARHAYCAAAGPCLSISLLYGSNEMPDTVLASVNRALRSLCPARRS